MESENSKFRILLPENNFVRPSLDGFLVNERNVRCRLSCQHREQKKLPKIKQVRFLGKLCMRHSDDSKTNPCLHSFRLAPKSGLLSGPRQNNSGGNDDINKVCQDAPKNVSKPTYE